MTVYKPMLQKPSTWTRLVDTAVFLATVLAILTVTYGMVVAVFSVGRV